MMHELHKLVMNNIDQDAGEFKRTQNMVGGELTTPPETTPTELHYLLDNLYNGSLAYAKTVDDKVRVLLSEEIAPFIIRAEDKAYYYKCLREKDENSLTEYALECISKEPAIINAILE
jgi:hypothetical protein